MSLRREIGPSELPQAALKKMSARQRSYIDEFRFFETPTGIEAWYANEPLAVWRLGGWHDPRQTTPSFSHPAFARRDSMKRKRAYRKQAARDEVPMPKRDKSVEKGMKLGILEAVWLDSYMSWAEEHGLTWTSGHIPQHVRDLDDIPQPVPQSAKKLAAKYASVLEKLNRATLTQIYVAASRAEGSKVDARELGFLLAMESRGHGIGWTDDHATFRVILPMTEWYAYGSKGKVQVEGWVEETRRLAHELS